MGLGVFCALFGGLALGAPCIRPVHVGVLGFFFKFLYTFLYLSKKKKKNIDGKVDIAIRYDYIPWRSLLVTLALKII